MPDQASDAVFEITGMSCGSCVAKVQQRLAALAGVSRAVVTLVPPEVRLQADRVVSAGELNDWLQPPGRYRVALAGAVGKATESPEASGAPSGETAAVSAATYRPLLILTGYLLAVVAAVSVARGGFEAGYAMSLFMGGFFIAFSFFKMLDLRGFAEVYRSYDLVAAAVPPWGRVYPFVELGLGLAFLSGWRPWLVNAATAVVMAVSLAGVLRAVLSKRKIRCACLGTVFNLPMTTVTIVEDGLMLGMALLALMTPH